MKRKGRLEETKCQLESDETRSTRAVLSLEAAQKTSQRLLKWGTIAQAKQSTAAKQRENESHVQPRFAQKLTKQQIADVAKRLSYHRPQNEQPSGAQNVELDECTFQPMRVARMEPWITSRYQYPPSQPHHRIKQPTFTPQINRSFPIQLREKDVHRRLYDDYLRQHQKQFDAQHQCHVQTSSKALDARGIQSFLHRQEHYEAAKQQHLDAMAIANAECTFTPHLDENSRRICDRVDARPLEARLRKANERRQSKLQHALASTIPSHLKPKRAPLDLDASVKRLSQPKPTCIPVPKDFDPLEQVSTSFVALKSVEDAYARQCNQQKARSLTLHLTLRYGMRRQRRIA
ncbi:hypothetical protein AeRB84_005929 [Aphanomyces euteiches]|nr:hypothetical protein AeRB84_005929 [Aphanomyces euteiches]